MKDKIFIGIFPKIQFHTTANPFDDSYIYSYHIIEAITKENAIPICLTLHNNKFEEEQLKLCAGIIFPGGPSINPVAYQVLKYAYDNKIPILGICLGMQTLAIFSSLLKENNWSNEKIKELEEFTLQKLHNNNHHKVSLTYDNLSESEHNIFIEPTSKLYEYFNKQIIPVYSFHDYAVNHIDKILKVTSFSEDGNLESVESNIKDWFAIGVQFHPELDKENTLIKGFIQTIKSQK